VPFEAAVERGAAAVMTAHVRYPSASPPDERDVPATLSPHWLDHVLRRQLGFGGVIVSDAIEMHGVRAGRELADLVSSGVVAGVDLFICEDLETAIRTRSAIQALVEGGGPLADNVRRSIERVRRWRQALPAGRQGPAPTEAILQAGERLVPFQERAVCRLDAAVHGLPLERDRRLVIVLPRELDANRPVDIEFLNRETRELFPRGSVVALEPQPTAGELRLLGELVAGDATLAVVLGVMGAAPETWVPRAVEALERGGGPRAGVALHRPVDVETLPRGWPRVLTYGFGRPALRALLAVLAGTTGARGERLGLGLPG